MSWGGGGFLKFTAPDLQFKDEKNKRSLTLEVVCTKAIIRTKTKAQISLCPSQ